MDSPQLPPDRLFESPEDAYAREQAMQARIDELEAENRELNRKLMAAELSCAMGGRDDV